MRKAFTHWKQEQWHFQDRMARIFAKIAPMNEEDGRGLFYLLNEIVDAGHGYTEIADALCTLVPNMAVCVNRK